MAQSPQPSQTNATNRLAREKSPYLLQHQHNPVDWFSWGNDAFEKARQENKPIFLSIGYSTCHWCHVMEREAFENNAIAEFLNEHFVSIKVDREERPDVDKIYMTFVQATTGQGGWPLNAFLTPDLKPFFGGTYWPPQPMHGRPGFLQVLQHVQKLWKGREQDVLDSAQDFHRKIKEAVEEQTQDQQLPDPSCLRVAADKFKQEFDPHFGGFGPAPKFPRPSLPAFLLHHGVLHKDEDAVRMVLFTCDKMAAGGIHDQIGGGFARYAVDAQWLVPHFEKMLYDNAQLAHLYLDAYLVSDQKQYADTARDIVDYVLRDMTHPEGGFFSAEDADSEGKEGKFYCWTREELSKLLTPEEFNVVTHYYGVTETGNFVDHSDPNPLPNQNVLSIVNPDLAQGDQPLLDSARKKMFQARERRVRPHCDDKVLTSWNGLMLSALTRAAAVLEDRRYLQAARRNHSFLVKNLWDERTQTLYHRWREGERDRAQLLNAYAFLMVGTLDLYEVTLEEDYLRFAIQLAEILCEKFQDKTAGGFWQSPPASQDLIFSMKDDHDGAEPSGNSLACLGLLRLGMMTERKEFLDATERTLEFFKSRIETLPQAVPLMLLVFSFWRQPPRRVVLAGDKTSSQFLQLHHSAHQCYQPNKVVLHPETTVLDEFTRSLQPSDSKPTAYLCSGRTCHPPVQDRDALMDLLISEAP